jgi:AcrR family transcriptional regulator
LWKDHAPRPKGIKLASYIEVQERSPRERLLDAGIAAIASDGLPSAQPDRLEAAAGLPEGAFADEFADDETWLLATMERVLVRRRRDYEEALAGLPPRERTLEGGIDAIWRIFPGELWSAWLVLFLEIRNRPGLSSKAVEMTTSYDTALGQLVPDFFAAEPGDTSGLLGVAMLAIDGMTLGAFVTEGLFDMDAVLVHLKRAVIAAARQ